MLSSIEIPRTLSAAQLPAMKWGSAALVLGTPGQAHVRIDADATLDAAGGVLLARWAQSLGCQISEKREVGSVELHARRAYDLLLTLDAAAHASPGEWVARIERLDRACGTIAARLALESVCLVDTIGVFVLDRDVFTRLSVEAEHRYSGLLPVAVDPGDYLEAIAARLGVSVLPVQVGEQHTLAVAATSADWRLYHRRWLARLTSFVANLPAQPALLELLATSPAPPPSGIAPEPQPAFSPEEALAELPESGAAGLFALDLVSPGPDVNRTAQLLARAAAMSPERAAQLVASAPVCVLDGVSAHVIRRVAVTVISGAGAELRARPAPTRSA